MLSLYMVYLAHMLIADAGSNFAINVELSGRIKKQHVLVHFGKRTIFGYKIKMKRTTVLMRMSISISNWQLD